MGRAGGLLPCFSEEGMGLREPTAARGQGREPRAWWGGGRLVEGAAGRWVPALEGSGQKGDVTGLTVRRGHSARVWRADLGDGARLQ